MLKGTRLTWWVEHLGAACTRDFIKHYTHIHG